MELAGNLSAPHSGTAALHRSAPARSPGRRLLVLALAAALLGLLVSGSALAEESPRLPVDEGPGRIVGIDPTGVTGTVSVRGCTPDAADIDLRAIPLAVGAPGSEPVALDPRQTQLHARVLPTRNPHAHGFSIEGLRPGVPYALSISVPSSSGCPKVFWRSASHGIAVGGSAVDIEGVAVTTNLEVLDPKTEEWVGADELDFADPQAGKRTFRWRSTLPDVVGGELQISTSKFATAGAFGACDEPGSGVVYRRQLTANETEVDFARVLSRQTVGDSEFRLLQAGAPLYARVVARTAAGPACDTDRQGVSGWVVLGKPHAVAAPPTWPLFGLVFAAGDGHVYTPPWLASGRDHGHPTYLEHGFRVVKAHRLPQAKDCNLPPYGAASRDPLGCALVTTGKYAGGTTLTEANRDWFYLSWVSDSGGGSGFINESLAPLVSATVEAMGLAVTSAAELYEDIKDAVGELAYDIVSTTPIIGDICSSHEDACMKAIRTGMTIGMTAMGLPPSLPNWEQLKQQGIDYLAAEAGEQIEETTEIPGSGAVAEWALKQVAQKALDELTANRGWTATGYDWVGPYEGFDPASWVVEVKKLTTDPLPPGGRLEAVHDGSLPRRRRAAPAQVPRERHPAHPDGAPAERHGHRRTALPRVVLHRSAGQLLADLRRDEADLPEPDECTAHPGTLWHDDPGCSSLAELVAIYYRDAWVANKLDVESCTSLGAATFLKHVEITPSQDGWLSLGTSWTSSVSYEATPLLTMSMIGFVPPKVGATWSGPFFKAC